MKKESLDTFGKRLKKARLDKDMSSTQLANISGVVHSAISNYESETRSPSLETIFKLSDALEVNPMWLKYGFPYLIRRTKNGIYVEGCFNNEFNLKEYKELKKTMPNVDASFSKFLLDNINNKIEHITKNKDYASLSAISQFVSNLDLKNSKDVTKQFILSAVGTKIIDNTKKKK